MALKEVLEQWRLDKPRFEAFRQHVERRLRETVLGIGIQTRIQSRTKDDVSLAKTLLKKKRADMDGYRSLSDRVALRVVCKFRKDIHPVSSVIEESFDVVKVEDKSSLLEFDRIGYRSLHLDVRLPDSAPDGFRDIVAEIQVRTMCDDVWAELHHDIGYKPLRSLPPDVSRIVYSMGGLLEVADDTIDRIASTISDMTDIEPLSVLKLLEQHFIPLVMSEYDSELSIELLESLLKPFSDWTMPSLTEAVRHFVDKQSAKITRILSERSSDISLYPYLMQPEMLLIFFMIDRKEHDLASVWSDILPIEDLEKISVWWGRPVSLVLSV
jgi:ppGpp synthetase/RelA/SpoT-type nucleotidyltranferase